MEVKESRNEPIAQQPKGRYRMDAIRWNPKNGKRERIAGFAWGDSVDDLVELVRHPKKNGGFDRGVVYLVGADDSEKIVENVHAVMGRLYCRGRVDFVEPAAGEEPRARKKRKSGRAV
jgi:hypothetical protein